MNYGFHCSTSGSGSFWLEWIGADFLATNPRLCMIGGSEGHTGPVVLGPGETVYTSLFGGGETYTTIGGATGLFPYALSATSFTNYITDSNGAATFTLLINGLPSVLAVSSGLGMTGYFTDNTDTVAVAAGDTCANRIAVAASGGSVTWANAALLLDAD